MAISVEEWIFVKRYLMDEKGFNEDHAESAANSLSRRFPAKVAVPNRQLRVVSAPQSGILEALLEVFDSIMTYRARYRAAFQPGPALRP